MILQRYILRELAASFAFAFFTVLAVCLVGTTFQVFRTFPGIGLAILSKALPLATGAMASWVTLVASCTSSTLVYARLAAENEITAMRTCGIHTGRIVAPAILLGLLLVGASYPLNEFVVPWTRQTQKQILRDSTVVALNKPPPGNQDFKIGNWRITYTDYQEGRMIRPTITQFTITPLKQLKLVRDYYAKSGSIHMDGGQLRIMLDQPRCWEAKAGGGEAVSSAEDKVTIEIPPEDFDKSAPSLVDLPASTLLERAYRSADPSVRNPILMILYTRYAASLAPLLFMLVGMPIGILVRRGSRLAGLGAALPPLLIYFVSYFMFQGLGDKNRVSPLVAAYVPDLFLGTLAMALQWTISRR